jgi:Ni/Co efflux regulator RcnB
MRRRRLLALAAAAVVAGATAGRAQTSPAQTSPAEHERQLDAWWARQREKEAADRFWNGPREQRRNLTRDQIDRWEAQRGYRGQGPTGLAGPTLPYGPYGFSRRIP